MVEKMDGTLEKTFFDYYCNSGFVSPHLKIDIPLYRYRGNLDYVLDEVSTGNLFLAPVYSLNDPFEATGVLALDEIRKKECPISSFWLQSFFLQNFVWSGPVHDALLPYWQDTTTLQKYADLVAKLVETEGHHYPSEAIIKNYYKYCTSLEIQRRNYGNIACFSEKYDSLSMWAYYANSHKGVCFKYDFSLLDLEVQENKNIVNSLHKVWYSDVRHPDTDGTFSPFFKAQSWSHEQEWRLFRKSGDQKLHLPCITEVYMGLEFDYQNLDRIVEAIVRSGRNIKLFEMISSPTDFSIQKLRINL